MNLRLYALVFAILGMLTSGITANAQLNYGFKTGTGTRITGGFTTLQYASRAGAAQESGWGTPASADLVYMEFDFTFNGNTYSEVIVSSNGLLMFGGDIGSTTNNDLSSVSVDVIAPFWEAMRVRGDGNTCDPSVVQYMVTGSAPNRIFVVDYDKMGLTEGTNGILSMGTFQVRLYEGSNKIEFYYDALMPEDQSCNQWGGGGAGTETTSASIGLATPSGFLSVSPTGSNVSTSTRSSDNNVDALNVVTGALYTFCPAGLTGNVAEGGTVNMANNDSLLLGKLVTLSSSQNYTPFTLISFCAPSFTYTITGPNASEYSITPNSGALPAEGNTPVLRFAPTGIGKRYATLTVIDGANFVNRTFILAGQGVPRTTWIGNIAQGGTATVSDRDTLMRNIAIYNGTVGNFTPLTIQVAAGGSTPAPITYTLTDPTGQFSIDRTLENVAPGGSTSPIITFAPTLVGWQTATLVVNAEGEVRSYLIRAFARGAGARFSVGGEELEAGASVFRNVFACVGAEVQTVSINVESIGDEPFLIETNDAYETDNIVKQGTPPFELLRDPFGNFIPVTDYFISANPGSKIPLELPVSIAPGTTQTIYLNFLPTRSGKRQARAFFQTNGLNFFGIDVDKNTVRGTLNFEMVGTGLGATMTNASGEKLPEALIFPATEVRSASRLTGYIKNNGECDMLIPSEDFRLVSGDVNEFKIVSPLSAPVNGFGNYVLVPGQIDSFAVEFIPSRSGSRRASLRVRSNDSSLVIRGLSEIGVDYIDVYGVGKVGLEARSVTLPPAVIDGPGSVGHALVENTSSELVTITGITIVDVNGEIVEDPTNSWPLLPVKVDPGQTIDLGLAFTPTPGSTPGIRNATLEVTLSNGNVLIVDVKGVAGTRKLSVAPTSLFQNLRLGVGNVRRQFIAVTNTGTFPVTIQTLSLTETNIGDYRVGVVARSVMEPGQIEFYEVTYSPQTIGASGGTVEIVSNTTNGPHIVNLGGEGTTIAQSGGNASGSNIAVTGEGGAAIRPSASLSGWGAAMQNGTLLWQSTPNPTEGAGEIRYYLPEGGNVELTLFTSRGEKVQELATGVVGSGEHRVALDLRSLSSGRYYYTLRTSGGALTLALDLVK